MRANRALVEERTGNLFGPGPEELWKRARNADPRTSKEAAESIRHFVSRHRALCLVGLRLIGCGTFEEIAVAAKLTPVQTWKRLSELEEIGAIRKTERTRVGTSGRQCTVWEPVEAVNS